MVKRDLVGRWQTTDPDRSVRYGHYRSYYPIVPSIERVPGVVVLPLSHVHASARFGPIFYGAHCTEANVVLPGRHVVYNNVYLAPASLLGQPSEMGVFLCRLYMEANETVSFPDWALTM